ncbi:MAG: hypothetical protein ACT4OX_01130 [Actinomycetota bacterium]
MAVAELSQGGDWGECARVRPLVTAEAKVLTVPGPLAAVLPRGGVIRGTTVAVDGALGAGATSVALTLAAAATATGEWTAFVDPHGTFGARAAATAGVELERCAIVRRVPPDRWPAVVAALLDGMALVVGAVPARLRPGDARRLVARARERACVLVALGPWPVEAAVRVRVEVSVWRCDPSGRLATRDLDVHVAGRGPPARGRLAG